MGIKNQLLAQYKSPMAVFGDNRMINIVIEMLNRKISFFYFFCLEAISGYWWGLMHYLKF